MKKRRIVTLIMVLLLMAVLLQGQQGCQLASPTDPGREEQRTSLGLSTYQYGPSCYYDSNLRRQVCPNK